MSTPIAKGVGLVNYELWRQFSERTTEMVITTRGRKLYPHLEFELNGLDPHAEYAVSLYLERVGNFKSVFGLFSMSCIDIAS